MLIRSHICSARGPCEECSPISLSGLSRLRDIANGLSHLSRRSAGSVLSCARAHVNSHTYQASGSGDLSALAFALLLARSSALFSLAFTSAGRSFSISSPGKAVLVASLAGGWKSPADPPPTLSCLVTPATSTMQISSDRETGAANTHPFSPRTLSSPPAPLRILNRRNSTYRYRLFASSLCRKPIWLMDALVTSASLFPMLFILWHAGISDKNVDRSSFSDENRGHMNLRV